MRNDKTFRRFPVLSKINQFLPFSLMFLSRDFSSDDNRDPVYLHASNNGARDVCDALENCASAKLTVVVYCNTYGPFNIIYKTNTYRAIHPLSQV